MTTEPVIVTLAVFAAVWTVIIIAAAISDRLHARRVRRWRDSTPTDGRYDPGVVVRISDYTDRRR